MCGIFGYVGKRNNAAQIVFNGLKSLEYRGYDSWGIAVVPTANLKLPAQGWSASGRKTKNLSKLYSKFQILDSNIIVKKQAGKIGNATIEGLPSGNLAIGHTRWATHGGVTDINAHPHLDCTKSIALIHNGIIENYDQIKKQLLNKGHKFISETDTEVAVHLIEQLNQKDSIQEAVRLAFNQFDGLNAIIIVNNQTNQLIAARNGSPLVIGFGKGENFLASDALALLPYTKQVYFLKDEQMAVITDHQIKVINVKNSQPVRYEKTILKWNVTQISLGKYPHFMLKEIYEQPQIISDISRNSLSQIQKLARQIKTSYGTYLVGCGTASYACNAGAYLFSKIARRHVNWAIGSEFGYQLDFLTDKSLVLALSQSGETMDTLESVKKARDRNAKIASITNVLGSTLYRESDFKLLLNAGPEIGVASTKAFTAKLACLTLLAYSLADKIHDGQKVINQAINSSKKVLSVKNVQLIKKLATKLKNSANIYAIGRGLSYPAALETALKIKEVSYIPTEGLAAGELKHGPLALIQSAVPVIAFLPDDETYGANLAGAMEVKARGAYVIGISYKHHEIFDYYLPVSDACEATIIPNIITVQLLAYYIAVSRRFDPDKPRNLAKSVTVK